MHTVLTPDEAREVRLALRAYALGKEHPGLTLSTAEKVERICAEIRALKPDKDRQ